MRKWLIAIIVVGLLASIVHLGLRFNSENRNKQYEIAFDFRDIVNITSMKPRQNEYMDDQLNSLRKQGVTTICISESSLDELEQMQRIDVFSAKELSLLTRDSAFDPGYTYMIFKNKQAMNSLSEAIKMSYNRIHINVEDWAFEGKQGLRISLPLSYAQKITLLPDESIMEILRDKGFQLIMRISNRVHYNAQYNYKLLDLAAKYNMRWVFFDGETIPGFSDDQAEMHRNLTKMAEVMKKNGLGLATIELLKIESKGLQSLARELNYDVVRIHSINERDANARPDILSDRISLAVKDRNIRIIFLNASVQFVFEKNKIVDTLEEGNLTKALSGPGGAIETLNQIGYKAGTAQPFDLKMPPLQSFLNFIIVLGALALLLLLLHYFLEQYFAYPAFFISLGTLGIYILSPTNGEKLLALAAAVSAPSLAIIYVLQKIKNSTLGVLRILLLFITACVISLVGAAYVCGLLFGVPFMVKFEYFSGVSLLYLLPIGIIALYVMIYYRRDTFAERIEFVKQLLLKPVNVLLLVLLALSGMVILYYLSRSGNSGTAAEAELSLRTFLENSFGARPRTKELLLGHPLFIFAAFLAVRYRHAFYLLIIPIIGQLSIVSSFTHLHTPLLMSFLRTIYGMAGGLLLGLIIIMLWQGAVKGWRIWQQLQRKS